jgi:NADPH-dependent 2,4-dienoyl-CoA reductase/sulfur reductase-like enzyme
MHECKYLILGGGVAGGYAAREFGERGIQPGDVMLVSADDRLPYERPPLSKSYLAHRKEEGDLLINKPEFYTERGIEVRLGRRATALDLEGRRLYTDQGEEFRFEKLLLCTGSKVRTLTARRGDLRNVLYLRSFNDAHRLRDAADHANRAVVIGGGYIGMETSAVLARKGLRTTLLADGDRLLPRLFTPEMSAFFESYFAARGVEIRKRTRAKGFRGKSRMEAVVLEDAKPIRADLAVVGVGVVPATDLLPPAGLYLEGSGVLVNEHLQTSVPNVFAAGDIAVYPDPYFNKRQRLEHWDNAVAQGQCAARNMMGEAERFDHLPYFFSDVFDLSWEFWGDTTGAQEVACRGNVGDGRFSAWWLRDGRLVAAFLLNRPDDEREAAQQWIREKRELSAADLQSDELPDLARSHAE